MPLAILRPIGANPMPARSSPREVISGRFLDRLLFVFAFAAAPLSPAWPHDIPNERIDRSIQVSLSRELIAIDYEVSLTELTLTQDLRRLIGSLPGAERHDQKLWECAAGGRQPRLPVRCRGSAVGWRTGPTGR